MKLCKLYEASSPPIRKPPEGYDILNKRHEEILKEQPAIRQKIVSKARELNALVPLILDRREKLIELQNERDEINTSQFPDEFMIKHKRRLEPLYTKLSGEHDRMQETYLNDKKELKKMKSYEADLWLELSRVVQAKKDLGPDEEGRYWS